MCRALFIFAETTNMPFTRFTLLICYVLVAAGITVFLAAQLAPQGQAQGTVQLLLPLALIAAIVIRALHLRLARRKPDQK
ncbi:hypothetical protein [Algirhabdus cladophorae]|uniref:hypothetical protein n=1 Tax=Algirhabdus cladophorae TaxID=3377108 RepID=UPI003B846C92